MTITITLPEDLEQFVANRASASGYDAAEYIVALLRSQATEAEQRSALEAKLLVGLDELDAGLGRAMTPADWDDLRKEIRNCAGVSEDR